MEIIVPRYLAPGRRLIDGLIPPSPPSETRAKWQAFLRRYLPTFTGRMPQTQADFAVQGLVNGGMVNGGHALDNAGIIRAHQVGGIPALQNANWYYKLEDLSWLDSTGNGLTLTPSTSNPTLEAAHFGANANRFTAASSQQLNHAYDAHFDLGGSATANLTVTYWLYFVSLPGSVCQTLSFASANAGASISYMVTHLDTGATSFNYREFGGSSNAINWGSNLTTATWYLVILRFNAGTAGISVNNATFVNAASASGLAANGSAVFSLAALYNAGPWVHFADVRIEHNGGWPRDIGTTGYNAIWNSGNGASVY